MRGAKISTREALLMGTIGILIAGWVIPRVPFVRRLTQNQAINLMSQMQAILDTAVNNTVGLTPEAKQNYDDLLGRLNTAGYNVELSQSAGKITVKLWTSDVTTAIV